ncbi:MAG: SUMF1/EgtB/PvdO family nonheme iron enzyme [Phycisphaerales bacterium]|jgi:formylglycine-generating enzyme required for sulfatase activity|nr:SUMF1/EgtB/PvdO family nonheme iron enzyme [Phycisphaerales bacterium]
MGRRLAGSMVFWGAALAGPVLAIPAFAQVGHRPLGTPDANGFYWTTVSGGANPAFHSDDFNTPFSNGRGSVAYDYRLSRLEISTAQWMEFYNAMGDTADVFTTVGLPPAYWGATRDTSYNGPGRQYKLINHPDAANYPVGAVTWRQAALYCNWLNNGKPDDFADIARGAYDTTTWGQDQDTGRFSDADTHEPGARYWIPSLDEWMKAAFWDPRKGDNNGWWLQPATQDEVLIGAPPWEGGESNAAFGLPNWGEMEIPIGSYVDVQSPWGLFDASGSSSEWLESWSLLSGVGDPQPYARMYITSYAGGPVEIYPWGWGGVAPTSAGTSRSSFRIASLVPSVPVSSIVVAGLVTASLGRRRLGV